MFGAVSAVAAVDRAKRQRGMSDLNMVMAFLGVNGRGQVGLIASDGQLFQHY